MNDERSVAARYLYSLVHREQITTFVRLVAFTLSVMMGFMAYGPIFDADTAAYQNPVFDLAFRIAAPAAWGVAFFAGGALLMIAALSSRALVYVVAVVWSAITLMAWTCAILTHAATSEANITSGAIGLYIGAFTGLIGIAMSPNQIVAQKPIVAIVQGVEEPIPLQRVG